MFLTLRQDVETMANNTKSTEISTILEKRYHQKVKVTELRSGRDKDVYLAKIVRC
uniref:Uncharacterized protein n=1 Tax=uncultured Alphaproteobacteria bacterium TaxID=91750 RepID=A0A6G8F275_9PROT|nr:hypothetical protein PlAlph_0220 [uncultured Alphaproteobacteria bacterium]